MEREQQTTNFTVSLDIVKNGALMVFCKTVSEYWNGMKTVISALALFALALMPLGLSYFMLTLGYNVLAVIIPVLSYMIYVFILMYIQNLMDLKRSGEL
jgi:hypothetical protein